MLVAVIKARIPASLDQDARAKASAQGVTVSELVRKAVEREVAGSEPVLEAA